MSNAVLTANEPISALLLDDDATDRHRINRMNKASGLAMNLEGVATLEAMHVALSRKSFDIVILDYQLAHGATGLDALNQLKSDPLQNHVRKIMITGDQRLDTAVSAFKLGCSDFLEKDKLTPELLRETVLSVNRSYQAPFVNAENELWPEDTTPISNSPHQELQNIMASIFNDTLHSDAMKSSLQLWLLEGFRQAAKDIDLTKKQTQSVVGDGDLAELINVMRNNIN